MTQEDLEVVERLEGKMPLAKALRCRVRYLSDGAVLGSAEFVETGARRMRGAEWGDLCVIRDLRREVMS